MTEDYEHELRKWEIKYKEYLESLKYNYDAKIKSFEATIQFAVSAIKSLIIINGGAAIACVTIIGSAIRNPTDANSIIVINFSGPITYFLLGVFFAVFAGIIAYLAQYFFTQFDPSGYPVEEDKKRTEYNKRNGRIANILQIMGIIFALASIILFVVGVFSSQSVLQGYIIETDNKLPASCECATPLSTPNPG